MHGCALKIPANTCKINIKVLLLVQKHMTRCFYNSGWISVQPSEPTAKKCGCRSTTFPQPRMMTIRLFLFRKKKKLCLLLEFSFGGTRNLPGANPSPAYTLVSVFFNNKKSQARAFPSLLVPLERSDGRHASEASLLCHRILGFQAQIYVERRYLGVNDELWAVYMPVCSANMVYLPANFQPQLIE